jgi:hypothetical protein
MHRDDGFRASGDGLADCFGINALGLGVAVHQHGGAAGDPHGFRRRKKRIGVGNQFIAFAQAQRHEGEPQRVGAVADADGILCPGIFG